MHVVIIPLSGHLRFSLPPTWSYLRQHLAASEKALSDFVESCLERVIEANAIGQLWKAPGNIVQP